MVRWVIGSIIHGMDPLSYFSFQPVLHDWCNKGHGMCYPVCGMVHIKESSGFSGYQYELMKFKSDVFGGYLLFIRTRCSSVVRAFAHGAMGCRIDHSWDGPIELFLVPASAPRLV